MKNIAVDRYIGRVWHDSFAEIVDDFAHALLKGDGPSMLLVKAKETTF